MPFARYLAANLSFGLVGYHASTVLTAWYVGGLDRIVWTLAIKPAIMFAPWFLVGMVAARIRFR